MIFDPIIQVKKPGTIFTKFKSPVNEKSILTITAIYSPIKFRNLRPKAGNKGQLTYSLSDSSKVDI